MRPTLLEFGAIAVLAAKPASLFAAGSRAVRGHVTQNGTHVAPSRATNPIHTQRDNCSAEPNANPYTGRHGPRAPAT